jgi:hypothetical protein
MTTPHTTTSTINSITALWSYKIADSVDTVYSLQDSRKPCITRLRLARRDLDYRITFNLSLFL